VRYKVTVTEQVPGPGLSINAGSITGAGNISSPAEVDGAVVFSSVVEFRPSMEKLAEALKAPRVRKPKAK
jgi:hypothetical protein